MAPGRLRRVQTAAPQPQGPQNEQQEQQEYPALFIDPMMGTPLPIYVDKDVEDRDNIARLITVSVNPTAWRGDPTHNSFQLGFPSSYELWNKYERSR